VTKHSSHTSASRRVGKAGVVCSEVYNAGDAGSGKRCSTPHNTNLFSASNLKPSSIHLKGKQTPPPAAAAAELIQVRVK